MLTDEVGEHKSGGPGYSSLAMNEHFIALVNAVYYKHHSKLDLADCFKGWCVIDR